MLGAIMFLEWCDLAVVPGVMSVTKLLCMVYSGCSACCVVLVLRVVFVLRAVLCVTCVLVRWSYLFCSSVCYVCDVCYVSCVGCVLLCLFSLFL